LHPIEQLFRVFGFIEVEFSIRHVWDTTRICIAIIAGITDSGTGIEINESTDEFADRFRRFFQGFLPI